MIKKHVIKKWLTVFQNVYVCNYTREKLFETNLHLISRL